MRLKLELSLLWAAVAAPFYVQDRASRWAQLLGLEGKNGVRQIQSGLRWLNEHELIKVSQQPGRGSLIRVLDEGGGGREYLRPNRRMSLDERRKGGEFYIQLPSSFWTNGWVQLLNGPAVAMLLILLDMAPGKQEPGADPVDQWVWLSLRMAASRYGITDDTRYAGLDELRSYGLVYTDVRTFQTVRDSQPRSRHHHLLDLSVLDRPPQLVDPAVAFLVSPSSS